MVDNIQNADGGLRPVSVTYSLLDLKKNHLTFLNFGFFGSKMEDIPSTSLDYFED